MLRWVEADLRRPWSQIGFGAALEPRYQRAIETGRTRRYILYHLSGMAVFDLFIFINALVIPDVLALVIVLDLAVLTPALLVLVWLMHRRIVSSVLASTLFLFPMIGTMLALMLASHMQNAVMIAFAIPMVMVYGCIALPLPVPQAAIVAIGATMLTAGAVVFHPRFDLGGVLFAIMLNLSMAGYLLFAAFRNEISERRFYLLNLRDALRSESLVERNRTLLSLSDTDGLTGIGNRRAFDARLESVWRDQGPSRTPVALMMIDIDHFKRLNDTYGHLGGDACLRAVAAIVDGTMRDPAAATFRYGGEEFAVILVGPEAERVDVIAEQVRRSVEAAPVALPGDSQGGVGVTVSIGCVAMVPDADRPHVTPIAIADAALYRAKLTGRNRVQMGLAAPDAVLQVA
ncbi:GGDEF domain-containing protein [Methylobacterium goesingense]|uniref:diguanylate cyclase n=1 Tax=Methylobacterium goesingense TaxID=243690 RepID=A0ABV2L9C5_9HYPH|nr:GGDEF domain-containing protein [Methylobacterium goesingense]